MSLSTGTKLGPYDILSPAGAGCPYYIDVHTRTAKRLGAAREQVAEATKRGAQALFATWSLIAAGVISIMLALIPQSWIVKSADPSASLDSSQRLANSSACLDLSHIVRVQHHSLPSLDTVSAIHFSIAAVGAAFAEIPAYGNEE